MTTTINADNGAVSGSAGLKSSADATGVLALQTNGTTAVTVDASQNVTLAGTLTTTGVTTVQAGTAALPAITTTGDLNTGIFFPAADTIAFSEGGAEAMRINSSGNVGIGTTTPVGDANRFVAIAAAGGSGFFMYDTNQGSTVTDGANIQAAGTNFYLYNYEAGFVAFGQNNTERMRIDSSGNLLVGATATSSFFDGKCNASATSFPAICGKQSQSSASVMIQWNAATTGDNIFTYFVTEASPTIRGSISYNRTAGLVAYNTTSDYRAKDIYGSIADSGALIDSVPVYMGKMKGATQERPMFIAHETPAYAHTGEKDAVDKDGNPVYQQMDASALIPVMWAEIQSLRQRVAQLESN